MLTTQEQKQIIVAMFENQDFGKKSLDDILQYLDFQGTMFPKTDALTSWMVESVLDAGDVSDIESDLSYAIDQLTKARNSIDRLNKQS